MTRSLLARKPIGQIYLDYSSTNITTGAWTQISAALPSNATAMSLFHGNGQPMRLSTGASGQEDASELSLRVPPGGWDFLVPIELAKNARLSAKAVGANITTGTLVITFFG